MGLSFCLAHVCSPHFLCAYAERQRVLVSPTYFLKGNEPDITGSHCMTLFNFNYHLNCSVSKYSYIGCWSCIIWFLDGHNSIHNILFSAPIHAKYIGFSDSPQSNTPKDFMHIILHSRSKVLLVMMWLGMIRTWSIIHLEAQFLSSCGTVKTTNASRIQWWDKQRAGICISKEETGMKRGWWVSSKSKT